MAANLSSILNIDTGFLQEHFGSYLSAADLQSLRETNSYFHDHPKLYALYLSKLNQMQVVAGADAFFYQIRGRWYVLGKSDFGQLTVWSSYLSIPVSLTDWEKTEGKIQQVVMGSKHSFIETSKAWYACGYNQQGQLGLGDYTCPEKPVPLKLPKMISSVVTGMSHTFFQIEASEWLGSGENEHGELGIASTHTPTPEPVTAVNAKPVQTIVAGINASHLKTESSEWQPLGKGQGSSVQIEGLINDIELADYQISLKLNPQDPNVSAKPGISFFGSLKLIPSRLPESFDRLYDFIPGPKRLRCSISQLVSIIGANKELLDLSDKKNAKLTQAFTQALQDLIIRSQAKGYVTESEIQSAIAQRDKAVPIFGKRAIKKGLPFFNGQKKAKSIPFTYDEKIIVDLKRFFRPLLIEVLDKNRNSTPKGTWSAQHQKP